MNTGTNKLDIIEVGKITGDFIVEDYQRGYRWDTTEVKCLLDDIYSAICDGGCNTYCLQPIVVKRREKGKYELVDGQQRLTTVFLIYKYISEATNGALSPMNISIEYATRNNSAEYLRTLDSARRYEYIDFYHMYNAYIAIRDWFEQKSNGVRNERTKYAFRMNDAFCDKVKVIWYEADGEDAEKLFARLNIGRIPLTCAELVKAMFLSDAGKLDGHEKGEIAMQWDGIERELRDDSFWYFLTDGRGYDDAPRIELVLDLMAGKKEGTRDKMYTFFRFDVRRKNGENLTYIWRDIYRTFLLLKGWYKDDELYHKIGYLIAVKKTLGEIFSVMFDENGKPLSKTAFKAALDDGIRASVLVPDRRNYGELTYTSGGDYARISRLLLLFNIMNMFELGDRFPFDKFKRDVWSLEHIHARHSQGLSKIAEWQAWLNVHAAAVETVCGETELSKKMRTAARNDKLTRAVFEMLHHEAVQALSPEGEVAAMHNISNLALLNRRSNSELSDSVFAVKRAKIIAMDSRDEYIPFCTKMVFLKYYSPDAGNMYFWSAEDRALYVKAINELLYSKFKYISEPIIIAEEGEE